MSKTKHTPGPWKLITDGPAKTGFEVRQISSGVLLAETRFETDAALIAAAPEMFEALELLVNAISKCPEYLDAMKSHGFDIEVVDALKESKSILKKAGGEK